MGLFCRIFDSGHSFRHNGCHHHIDGRAHRHHVHINMIATQCIGLGNDQTMGNVHICPQRPEAFQMLIDGTAADITASRKRHLGLFIFAQQRAQQIIRCSDFFNIVTVYNQIMDL